jgi:type 1 glutamine amidotransferase
MPSRKQTSGGAMILFLMLLGASANAQAAAPNVVMMIGEDEYHTWETLPEFAKTELTPPGMRVVIVQEDPQNKHHFPGIVEALSKADLLVLSARRRLPPVAELDAVRNYLDSGKPLVGIRTACHAFAPQGRAKVPPGSASWIEFDPQVLGGHYVGHYDNGPMTKISIASGAERSVFLNGIDVKALVGNGSLYRVSPLNASCNAVLLGTISGKPTEPVVWTHQYGPGKARIFYTSLGHPDDFKEPAFRRLLLNGILWALGQPNH